MISWTMGYNCNDNCTNSGANLVMIADIILPNTTHGASLHNLRKFQPGGVDAFNEVSTFLPDDSGVIVTSSYLTRDFWHSQLYKMSFSNPEQLIPLTSDLSSYSEHPCYSPDFSMIVYMTTAGDRGRILCLCVFSALPLSIFLLSENGLLFFLLTTLFSAIGGTDWWIMV